MPADREAEAVKAIRSVAEYLDSVLSTEIELPENQDLSEPAHRVRIGVIMEAIELARLHYARLGIEEFRKLAAEKRGPVLIGGDLRPLAPSLMPVEIVPPEVRAVVDAFGHSLKEPATVPCGLCGTPTPMTGTRRCDRCWELERRIDADPGLAQLLIKDEEVE